MDGLFEITAVRNVITLPSHHFTSQEYAVLTRGMSECSDGSFITLRDVASALRGKSEQYDVEWLRAALPALVRRGLILAIDVNVDLDGEPTKPLRMYRYDAIAYGNDAVTLQDHAGMRAGSLAQRIFLYMQTQYHRESGEWQGVMGQSEADLITKLAMSRTGVRYAIDMLRELGLIQYSGFGKLMVPTHTAQLDHSFAAAISH